MHKADKRIAMKTYMKRIRRNRSTQGSGRCLPLLVGVAVVFAWIHCIRHLALDYSIYLTKLLLTQFFQSFQGIFASECPENLDEITRVKKYTSNLSNLTKLELLDISGTHIKELLDSIGELKQLSYFDLSRTLIQCLPRGVCSLGNLWTLKLAHCPNLTHLPEDMSGLTKLKHLDIKETPLKELPYSIGQLENLSYLDVSGTDIQCLPDGGTIR
ncbi:hypothetical protein V6N11_001036 [Hibiscus sabdariffa]|uniref:Disease resistance R13L4/SHOC-2-like LRR domain-containing protein n=1 Tax=Hibiscus sabdariffa TaxID=183260 RepID=A0ABR2RYI4_9ROSI